MIDGCTPPGNARLTPPAAPKVIYRAICLYHRWNEFIRPAPQTAPHEDSPVGIASYMVAYTVE